MYGLMDTRRVMPEESATPHLVELTRQANDAMNRGDFDAAMLIASLTVYPEADIDEARAAAERLARERW